MALQDSLDRAHPTPQAVSQTLPRTVFQSKSWAIARPGTSLSDPFEHLATTPLSTWGDSLSPIVDSFPAVASGRICVSAEYSAICGL